MPCLKCWFITNDLQIRKTANRNVVYGGGSQLYYDVVTCNGYKFQMCWLCRYFKNSFSEFLEASNQLYQTLLTETHSPRDIVVPTDHTTEPQKEKLPAHNTQSTDSVDGMKFFRSLSQLPDKHRFRLVKVMQIVKKCHTMFIPVYLDYTSCVQ